MSNCSQNPNGPGCRNGELYCNDPRCYPNCENCSTTTSSGNWIIITIILILLGVLLVMAFIVGFDWYKKTKKAQEPKNCICLFTVIFLGSCAFLVFLYQSKPTIKAITNKTPNNLSLIHI